MPAERFYVIDDLLLGQDIELEGLEFHHLVNVMRIKIGESVELVNGRGSLASATIKQLEKKRAFLSISEVFTAPKNSHEVILAQAIPRLNRLDNIVEKGTELGMTALWLFPAERSERKELTETQIERLLNLSIAAMKQCGRLYLPAIVTMPPISKWTSLPYPLYFGDLSPAAPLLIEALGNSQSQCIFCTGPESGFTDDEELFLKKLGAKGVRLHQHILRTDTASLAALALITHRFAFN